VARIKKLPQPDEFGNFWLAKPEEPKQNSPAIFPSKRLNGMGEVCPAGRWYVTMGRVRGFLMDGLRVRTFPSAEAALMALNEAL
jgi:hypothetical protein